MVTRMGLGRVKKRARPPALWLALAGVEVGVLGGLCALLYHMLDGIQRGAGPWEFANLVAGTFYPGRALSYSFSRATLAGVSFHLIVSGLAGAAFSFALARFLNSTKLSILVALCLSAAWYYLGFRFLWAHLNPAIVIHQPFPGIIMGHLIFGFCMGLYPRFVRELGPWKRPEPESPFV